MLKVTEIYRTIQGEGMFAGTPVLLIRFSGCNKNCDFCDTQHTKYTSVSVDALMDIVVVDKRKWQHILLTGGEPLIQDDIFLFIEKLHQMEYSIHLETNGSIGIKQKYEKMLYSLSLSPKIHRHNCKISKATSLKFLYPCDVAGSLDDWVDFPADWKGIQPLFSSNKSIFVYNTNLTVNLLLQSQTLLSTGWKLSLQQHRYINIK